MKIVKLIAILATTAALNANATLLYTLDGEMFDAADSNDFLDSSIDSYNIGGNLFASEEVDLTFTYLGHEAGYNNDFTAYDLTLNNKSNSVGDSFYVSGVSEGLIDFNFYSNSIAAGVTNGANMPFASPQSFAIMLDYTWSINGVSTFYDAVIFFDDSGKGPDDNHDDHIIGINAKVPEPSTFALLALGFAALIVSRRRVKPTNFIV